MADGIPPTTAPIVLPDTVSTSRVRRLLRRVRGQTVESKIKEPKVHSITENSPGSSVIGKSPDADAKQARSDTYAEGGLTKFYEPIPEYEGRHRWDPRAEWSAAEEKKLIRKLDYRICSWACLMFFALQLDRGNIVQAVSDNMLNDLDLNTNQYNYGQTIFYLCFLFAELPSQMISKKLGPDIWIPIQMCSWSVVAICQCKMTDRSGYYATRAFLGLLEGGFIADVILYLSYFYKGTELPIRLSYFWGAYISTNIVSAFLAFGILRLGQTTSWAGWRWLFLIEGIVTAVIGILSAAYLPPSPTQTKSWFRGKDGWFSDREEIIMVNRVLRDDPGKGGMHNRQGINFRLFWDSITDYDMWPIYLLGLTWSIPSQPITSYLTLTLRGLGWDTFEVNLLTIPAYVLFLIQLIFWTWLSEKINNRFLIVLFCQIYMLPILVALEILPAGNAWGRYVLSILLVGFPYIHAIIGSISLHPLGYRLYIVQKLIRTSAVALTSRNAGSVRTRTIGSAIYNMTVQASNIISSNIYRDNDKPLYRRGNKALLGIVAWNFVFIIAIKGYYMWRNASRETKWNAMTQEEKVQYLATTSDKGNKRLDFRFAH
ncbi:MAG: hypothetical protein M1818_001838 [Claussenomyces sp. TS43310]|nr:MAG: hypothetical protein M1818_001838 [Claussenomyces sp. TS43310]